MRPGRPTPILFVHHRSELGGAPESLSYLIRELDREQFEPHVYCPPGPAAELFREAGAVVHTGAVSGFTHIWASTYRGRRWLLFGRELVAASEPRPSVPADASQPAVRARALQRLAAHPGRVPRAARGPAGRLAPALGAARSAGTDGRSALIRRAIRRLATTSIAINRDVAEVFDVGSTVVPNSVDLQRFRPGDRGSGARGARSPGPTCPSFRSSASSIRRRASTSSSRQPARLRDRGVDASYLVVGGAVRGQEFFRTVVGRSLQLVDLTRDYESEAKELVHELGLDDVVRFIPFTQDTTNLYQASDVVVAPSQGPELGRPVIEAAASGVPVVASGSRTGGGVVVPGETGVLVPDYGVDSIADAVAELLRDADRRQRARPHGARARGGELRPRPQRTADRVDLRADPAEDATGSRSSTFTTGRSSAARRRRSRSSSAISTRASSRTCSAPRARRPTSSQTPARSSTPATSRSSRTRGTRRTKACAGSCSSREISSLQPHIRQLSELMREHRFPLVHLNDSPLLAAAWVARKHGAKVVWHLRSALAGEGRDRRSRMIGAFMNAFGDAAIAIDRDVAARFPIRLPLADRAQLGAPALRRPASAARPRSACRRTASPSASPASSAARRAGRSSSPRRRSSSAKARPAHFVIMGGGVRPPEYFKTIRGRALALTNLLTDEESAIKDLVAAKGLDDRFSFLPFTAETGEIYNALDIVTFPNQGVGLGRPVLEAATYGKPVVASGSDDGRRRPPPRQDRAPAPAGREPASSSPPRCDC